MRWNLYAIAALIAFGADANATANSLEHTWRKNYQSAMGARPNMRFPHQHCFTKAAAAYQLPEPLLLAVARGESNFDPHAKSKANAYGLMQILWPMTAKHLGIERLSELFDPCINVDAGARYLKELMHRYRGNAHRALAAYNYGPSRIPVTGGLLPEGAVWYSGYILRHLQYVLRSRSGTFVDSDEPSYQDQRRLFVIRFNRPYRAAAFVRSVQPRFGDIRLDWFRRSDGEFDVYMLFPSNEVRDRGRRLLTQLGL